MLQEIAECPLLGVDLEYCDADANKKNEGIIILGLIQISTSKSDYIFDCFSLRNEIRNNE